MADIDTVEKLLVTEELFDECQSLVNTAFDINNLKFIPESIQVDDHGYSVDVVNSDQEIDVLSYSVLDPEYFSLAITSRFRDRFFQARIRAEHLTVMFEVENDQPLLTFVKIEERRCDKGFGASETVHEQKSRVFGHGKLKPMQDLEVKKLRELRNILNQLFGDGIDK